MATMHEVENAVKILKKWCKKIIILHCVSNIKLNSLNLSAISSLRKNKTRNRMVRPFC